AREQREADAVRDRVARGGGVGFRRIEERGLVHEHGRCAAPGLMQVVADNDVPLRPRDPGLAFLFEVEALLADPAVEGVNDAHVVSALPQCIGEGARDVGEPARLEVRRGLGRGEQDPHGWNASSSAQARKPAVGAWCGRSCERPVLASYVSEATSPSSSSRRSTSSASSRRGPSSIATRPASSGRSGRSLPARPGYGSLPNHSGLAGESSHSTVLLQMGSSASQKPMCGSRSRLPAGSSYTAASPSRSVEHASTRSPFTSAVHARQIAEAISSAPPASRGRSSSSRAIHSFSSAALAAHSSTLLYVTYGCAAGSPDGSNSVALR